MKGLLSKGTALKVDVLQNWKNVLFAGASVHLLAPRVYKLREYKGLITLLDLPVLRTRFHLMHSDGPFLLVGGVIRTIAAAVEVDGHKDVHHQHG